MARHGETLGRRPDVAAIAKIMHPAKTKKWLADASAHG
jgi:hypothetical protein